jgi:hypothetical protein
MPDVSYASRDKFDRALGGLVGIPDVIHTKPSTLQEVSALVGSAQTFIIQTFRQREEGDTIFLQYVDETGTVRMVLPPKVADLISRQRDSLGARVRSQIAKATAANRKAMGLKPGFMMKKK